MPNVEDIMGADNQCAGMSPRSAASDDIAGGSPGNSDDEAGENLNDRHQRQPSTLSDSMHTVTAMHPWCLMMPCSVMRLVLLGKPQSKSLVNLQFRVLLSGVFAGL